MLWLMTFDGRGDSHILLDGFDYEILDYCGIFQWLGQLKL
jgi:hypothetical protein